MHFFGRSFVAFTLAACLLAVSNAANGQAAADSKTVDAKQSGGTKRAAATSRPRRDSASRDAVQQEILSELRQIRLLLEKSPQPAPQPTAAAVAPPPAPVEKAKVSTVGFEMGSKNAPITIVEFADYQCPYCRQFHTTVFTRLKKDYIDTGKVRFVSRDLPLDFHPNALSAALAARCAGEQDKYWEMRDTLISHSDRLGLETLTAYAQGIGLDLARFNGCLDKRTYSESINQDLAEATAAGISGTPSFVIGPSGNGSVYGEELIGAQSYETFQKVLANVQTK